MVIKLASIVVKLVAGSKKGRKILFSLIAGICAPLIFIILVVGGIGKAASNFNCSMAGVAIGELDADLSTLPNQMALFYSKTRVEIAKLNVIWEEGLIEYPIENDTMRMARRVLMKSTYFVYLLHNSGLDEENAQGFVEVYLMNEKAADIFGALAGRGISFTETERRNIFSIWSYVLLGRVPEGYTDPFGIWGNMQGDTPPPVDGMYRNPLSVPWDSVVSSEFGWRIHPITHENKLHNGIDLAVKTGTEVHSSSDGTVIISTFSSSAGNYIAVTDSEGYVFYYMHLSERLVNVGDTVSAGDLIAKTGNTGNSTGPHLHFGVKNPAGDWINPREVVSAN